jgi:hypothetical protein
LAINVGGATSEQISVAENLFCALNAKISSWSKDYSNEFG